MIEKTEDGRPCKDCGRYGLWCTCSDGHEDPTRHMEEDNPLIANAEKQREDQYRAIVVDRHLSYQKASAINSKMIRSRDATIAALIISAGGCVKIDDELLQACTEGYVDLDSYNDPQTKQVVYRCRLGNEKE